MTQHLHVRVFVERNKPGCCSAYTVGACRRFPVGFRATSATHLNGPFPPCSAYPQNKRRQKLLRMALPPRAVKALPLRFWLPRSGFPQKAPLTDLRRCYPPVLGEGQSCMRNCLPLIRSTQGSTKMHHTTGDKPRRDPYQDVTDRILEALEAGIKPWVRPWNPDQAEGPQAPFNPTTGKHYRGINVLLLGMDPRAVMSGDPRWMTYQQAKEQKWQVRKGEKATTIFFYKSLEVDDPEAEDGTRTIPMLKTYSVFHASQVDGIPAYVAPTLEEAPWQRPEAADLILRNSAAVVRIGGGQAFYSPGTDHIQLPPEVAFRGPHEWAAVALHELGHWTGHKTRLNRDLSGKFGSGAYAQEELRAELASAFIGGTLGLPTDIPQHASYLAHWVRKLKEDKREIFRAAADAQKIADFALAFHPAYALAMKAERERVPEPEQTSKVDRTRTKPQTSRRPNFAPGP